MKTFPSLALRASLVTAVIIGATMLAGSAAHAQPVDLKSRLSELKQAELNLVSREARARMAEARREAREARASHGKKGAHARKAGPHVEEMPYDEDVAAGRLSAAGRPTAGKASVTSTMSLPTNALLNDKTPDGVGAGQAEENYIQLGNQGVGAWNDGQGFNTGGDVQTLGFSVDGGVTWSRTPAVSPAPAGSPPHFSTSPVETWSSDPVLSVNEKTGQFWYTGLINRSATTGGVGAVSGTISGSTFTWGTPVAIKTYSTSTALADKEWFCADSSNGNLYSVWVKYTPGSNAIMFSRSTNGGTIWSAEVEVSSVAERGNVQGPRVVVGPAGEVYITWWSVGISTSYDNIYVRKSTNAGVSFGAEVLVTTEFSNFGTGAPGFNRPQGIQFPSINVDRSTGPHRGRVYVAFEDAVNWFDDVLSYAGDVGENPSEVGTNDSPGTAIPFSIGQTVRGSIISNTDLDYYSFSATQGSSYIFYCDSLAGSLAYTMRIFCTDGVTRLAYSGASLNIGPGSPGFILWTAPATGTYYLRMASGAATGSLGGYRVRTGIDTPSGPPQRARDQRDDFVTYSDDGTTWSTPVMVNDDAALYDNFLPEVGVGRDGNPYVMWYDWRDSPGVCGGASNIYITRSDDGGSTWEPSRVISTAQTNWTNTASNIAPNQGDYQGLYGGAVISLAWADGRLGDADVWGTSFKVGPQNSCTTDTTVAAGTVYNPWYNLINPNVMFDDTYQYNLTVNRSWPATPISGAQPVARGSAAGLSPSIAIPDTAAQGDVQLCLTVSLNGAAVSSCCSTLHVTAAVTGVGGGPGATFALLGARPNPTFGPLSVAFSLPDGAPAKLELVDIAGRLIYEREVGGMGAGFHVVPVDRSGLPVGIYAVRLSQHGRTLTSKVSVVR